MMHFNTRSLTKNFVSFYDVVSNLPNDPDIICISETRLYDEKPLSNVSIEGYNFIHTPTKTGCGGVAIYIKDSLEFEVLNKFSKSLENIAESVFIEIKNPRRKNIIIYIPPSHTCFSIHE